MSKKKKAPKVITIGSVVQLKSGGPHMVVVRAESTTVVSLTVLWADDQNRLAKADVPIQALKLIKQ